MKQLGMSQAEIGPAGDHATQEQGHRRPGAAQISREQAHEDWLRNVEAAQGVLDAARRLVDDIDPVEEPQSAFAARRLLATCAGLFLDVLALPDDGS